MNQLKVIHSGKDPQGPPLKAQIILNEKGVISLHLISKVDLAIEVREGFTWEILSCHVYQKMIAQMEEWIDSYCQKRQPMSRIPVVLDGLPSYTRQVLEALREQPFGMAMSYQSLAIATGKPTNARAAGNACGRNPCLLIIPCHRVLPSNGKLGGFSAGTSIKQALLAFEGM